MSKDQELISRSTNNEPCASEAPADTSPRDALWEEINEINDHEVLDLLFSQVDDKVKTDLDSVDGLDGKASILAGIVATMLIILGAVTLNKPLRIFTICSLVAVGLFVVSICLSLLAYWPRDFSLSPDPKKLIGGYCAEDIVFIKKNIMLQRTEDFHKNARFIKQKKRLLVSAVIALLAGVLVVAVAVSIKLVR